MRSSVVLGVWLFAVVGYRLAAIGQETLAPARPPTAESRLPAADGRPPEAESRQDLVFFADARPVLMRIHVMIDGRPFMQTWREMVRDILKSADEDGDGVLDLDEVKRLPPMQALPFSNAFIRGLTAKEIPTMDREPRDGKVTLKELCAFYADNELPAFQFQPPGPTNNLAEQLNDRLFKLLDADRDGKLSRAELAGALPALLKLDFNDDEVVALDELVSNSNITAAILRPAPQPRLQRPEDSQFVLITPGETPRLLVHQFMSRYGDPEARLRDKKLKIEDLGIEKEVFDELDRNQDARLDGDELARFGERTPDLELSVHMGRRADKEPLIEVLQTKESLKASVANLHSGPIFQIGNARIEFAVGDPSGLGTANFRFTQVYQLQFKAADADNNGYVDKKEAERTIFVELFESMDKDGNGMLFEKEMLAFVEKLETLQKKAHLSRVSLGVADQGRGLFDLLDKNRDGRLGLRELRRAAHVLVDLNKDGDGVLARRDIPRSYVMTTSRGAANAYAGQFVVTGYRGGLMNPAPPVLPGPVWFRKMDRNRDGDVSPQEFLGTPAQFKELDADGDGLVNLEEAEAADKRLRAK